jgi:hypothetical protein
MGSFTVIGYNPSATNTASDIWPQNILRTNPTVAVILGVSSNSANDAAAGTGARTVRIWGVDANWAELIEDVTLTGTTEADTTGYFLHVNGMKVLTAGSTYATNAGIIYVYDASDTVTAGVPQTATKIFGRIVVGDNITTQSMYTVPTGQACILRKVLVHSAAASATARYGTVFLKVHNGATGINKRFYLGGMSTAQRPLVWFPKGGLRIKEKTTIALEAINSGAHPIIGIMEFENSLNNKDVLV